ncbi:MAG TPA: hypothetical protein VLA13_10265 [Massilibacterium sp.]|nr:hypothetical protein [Massilibacterium sp.]
MNKIEEFLSQNLDPDIEQWNFIELKKSELITIIAKFARAACEEQRQICARTVSGWPNKIKTESDIEDDIRNAPNPDWR